MKFFNFLHSTKRLSQQSLLDIALVLSFLPHLFTLKIPMLVYLAVTLVFIIKKKSSKKVIIAFSVLGLIAIALSFFAEYNFSNFSRLLVFISLLTSLLTYAVLLQRLTQTLNFYLLISPAMLMVLSFFFFNSIGMLFYALFTLFVFTFLVLYERMQSSVANALRVNTLLFLFSLPIVALLFLTFPRISYKKARFGFSAEEIKRTGHDGTMHIDSNAMLVPSPKLVMEVTFEGQMPSSHSLYFRGSVLYTDMGSRWVQDKRVFAKKTVPLEVENIINYKVKLYPHNKQWLYMLDIPLLQPVKTSIDKDLITRNHEPVKETLYYDGRSALGYTLPKESPPILMRALRVDTNRDARTYTALMNAIDPKADDLSKANELLKFFSDLKLSYSLRPKQIDLEHPVDSFLFDSKIGYCVHFASAFANSARMIGIPSRIVTGYKADRANAINNYLLIKEADAHAWVELYLPSKGWVRFEPTSTAWRTLAPDNPQVSNAYTSASLKLSTVQKLFKQINIYYMYTRYLINNWIIQYSRIKQMSLMNELLTNTIFLLKFLGSIIAFVLLCIISFLFLQRASCDEPVLCEMKRLVKALKRRGLERRRGETMSAFLQRAKEITVYCDEIEEINRLYHLYRYADMKDKSYLLQLRTKVHTLSKLLKNG